MHFMTRWISLRRTFNFCEKTLRNKKVRFGRTCARLDLFRGQIYLGNPINHAKYSQYYRAEGALSIVSQKNIVEIRLS